MPPTDPIVDELRNAIRGHDWNAARLTLHPYLHWTRPDGTVIRGRQNVLAMLTQAAEAPAPPRRAKLRDGQTYRWVY